MCLGEALGWILGLETLFEPTSLEFIQRSQAIVCLRAIDWESNVALPHNTVDFVTLGSFPAPEPHWVLRWAGVCHSGQQPSSVEAAGTMRLSLKLKSQVLQICVEVRFVTPTGSSVDSGGQGGVSSWLPEVSSFVSVFWYLVSQPWKDLKGNH